MKGTYDSASLMDFVNTLVQMGKVSRLKKINLSRNYLDVDGFSCLGSLLTNGPSTLCELYLQSCGGTSIAIKELMQGLKNNKTLQLLDLRDNDIGVDGASYIADALQSGPKLKQLMLSNCNLESAGSISICQSLMTNISLEILNIGDNNIGDSAAPQIALLLESNKVLKYLCIPENAFTDYGMAYISKSLMKNKNLAFLGIQWNFLTNDAAELLGNCLMQNNSLKAVHILGNAIDRIGIKSILEGSKMLNTKPIDVDMAGMNCCVVSAPPTPTNKDVKRRSRPTTATNRPISANKSRK